MIRFHICTALAAGILAAPLAAQTPAPANVESSPQVSSANGGIAIDVAGQGPTISRDIFGQFAEHLGEGIYGGIWVGKSSKIPNVRGIRSDVVEALRTIRVPVVRWPGGCFADQYHWRDGIGRQSQRRARLNSEWGNVIEPNSFGTHEFMDFVEQIGSEAYVSINVGSGTVQEAADWLEYMTVDKPTALGRERAANGRAKPWRIKYLGIGNESWGCGGPMSADSYVNRMKVFNRQVKNYNPEQTAPSILELLGGSLDLSKLTPAMLEPGPKEMKRIAVGPGYADSDYTEAVMKSVQAQVPGNPGVNGLSLHYYTTGPYGVPLTMSSTEFGNAEYAVMLQQALETDRIISRNAAIMDKYDPARKVSISVDEWGAWLKPLSGRNPLFLYQQNSLRDAISAALTLNIFARHADRVRMANIAQMVNVIQSMILTDGSRMLLTPTYHVYSMYVPFHDAQLVPASFPSGEYREGKELLPQIDAIAARATDGRIWLSIVNLDPERGARLPVKIGGVTARSATGQVLTAKAVNSVNTFEKPSEVAPQPYSTSAIGGDLVLEVPAKSIMVVQVN